MTLHLPSAPLVSIVMPTYNRAEYILATIKSIQKQTYASWELIIVDDGSDDNTRQIVNQIDDERIKYYFTSHAGMEHSRKMGLEKAKGDYIGFMDSDDLWAPTKLYKQAKYLLGNSQIAFTLTGGYEFKNLDEPLVFYYKQRTGTSQGDLFVPFFESKVVAATPSLLFRRECLDTVSYSDQSEFGDVQFILALAKNYKGVVLYEPLLFRRVHNSNHSLLNRANQHHRGVDLIKFYKKDLPRAVFNNALLRSHINHGELCLSEKERINAILEFIQAWRYQPLSIIPVKKIVKALASQH
ncbi:MAG: glycosyltransferase family 2 protein [Flavisolibacter sp.]